MAQSAKLKNLYQKLAERMAQSVKLKNLYQKLAERMAHGAWRRAQN